MSNRQDDALPELPAPYHIVPGLASFCKDDPLYSAEQMRAYAMAAIASMQAQHGRELKSASGDAMERL
jgi:hypothetical protein